jgi:SPP1 gp7 family putative phage head morphogenesis protein
MAPRKSQWKMVQQLADGARPEFIATFIDAVKNTLDATSVQAIEEAIAEGNWSVVQSLIPWDIFEAALRNYSMEMASLASRAGKAAITYMPKKIQLAFNFNVLNPTAVKWTQERTGALIVEVSGETKEAVTEVIHRAFIDGMHPRQSARHIKNLVGLTKRQAGAVDNLRRRLMKEGASDEVIAKRTQEYAKRLLAYRAETIARTETLAASNSGTYQSWLQARDEGFLAPNVVRKWIVTPDDRLCPLCQQMTGATAGLEEPFNTPKGPMYHPPLHPDCRCTAGLVPS